MKQRIKTADGAPYITRDFEVDFRLRTVILFFDIPEMLPHTCASVDVINDVIEALGFEVGSNLIANPTAGLSIAVLMGECAITDTDRANIKFGNNTAGTVGPFADVAIRITQIPSSVV